MKPSPAQHLPSWQPLLRQPAQRSPSPHSWQHPKGVANCTASSRSCRRSNETLRSCSERMDGCRWPLSATVMRSRSFSHIPTLSSSPSSNVDPWTFQQDRSCLLYTSDAADEEDSVDLGGRRIIKNKKA